MTSTFGNKIKEARIAQGLSQEALAKQIGKSRRTVIDWENGKVLPRTRKTYAALSQTLGISVPQLLVDESPVVIETGVSSPLSKKRQARQYVYRLSEMFRSGDINDKDMRDMIEELQSARIKAATTRSRRVHMRSGKTGIRRVIVR